MPDVQEDTIGPWVLGTTMGILGFIGLVLASAAEDTVFYGTGLALFLFGVLFVFGLIQRWVGR
jgi:hypothetical protein